MNLSLTHDQSLNHQLIFRKVVAAFSIVTMNVFLALSTGNFSESHSLLYSIFFPGSKRPVVLSFEVNSLTNFVYISL